MDSKNEINWETFLENYFSSFETTVLKKPYGSGLTLNFNIGEIYIWFNLDSLKLKIKKIEFGRTIALNDSVKEPNWIKAIFNHNSLRNIEFSQTSWFGDEGKQYEIEFGDEGKLLVKEFLNIPFETGWTEEEYALDPDINYKVLVLLDDLKWSITLKDIGEQDLPMIGDGLNQWLRVKSADAFWNNKNRIINRIIIKPITNPEQ